MNIHELAPNDFEYFGRWVTPTLAWELIHRWGEGELLKNAYIKVESTMVLLDGHAFFPKSVRAEFEKKIKKALFPLRKVFFENYIEGSTKIINNFLELETKSIEELLENYTELECPWIAVFFMADCLEAEIKSRAAALGYDAEAVIASLVSSRKTLSTEAQDEMRNIKALMRAQKPGIDERIDSFVEKYAWMGTHHFWGEPLTRERLLSEIDNLKEIKIEEKTVLEDIDSDVRFLMNIAEGLIWIRTQCAEVAALVTYRHRPLITEAARSIGMGYDDIIWLTHKEIITAMQGGNIVSLEEIEARKKGWGTVLEINGSTVFTGDELSHELGRFVPQAAMHSNDVSEIKGTVASKGMARGIVRVIHVPHKVLDFETGMILVAPETTPDYIALMKQAAAIITDKGGITSHAAIVSRELGIPCITGTNMATQALHDGDLVEVDAQNGIVKIIK